ncbi:DNA topoisomerase 3-alpha-like [Mya arenaria]|uniref:DNA topoisomerase 3-alpha-like n=1 Tax=Mya arenaria TaxID=6604 RepID=UPI0022E146D7|nr:DNA topoisomerase 3-alpha-like [Mya arenaria]
MFIRNAIINLLKLPLSHRFSTGRNTNMVKVLNVAEKNDAAKCIADVMSRGRFNRKEGFSKFNKLYEFEYMLFNQRCNMVMTSVSGHLLGLEFTGQYKKWHACSPVSLFDAPVEKYCPENFIDIKRTLEREVRGSQFLVVWTDCDREGENIGFEVIQVCKAIKPNIQVYRAKFSEITPQAIARACNNLIQPDKRVSDAVDVRQELDLRIGAAFTRFQTLRLQKIFPNVLADQLISYGSCQFPTLGFVVERYKQVQAFVPEPFWKLRVKYKMDEVDVEFNWKRNRLFDYMACFILYQQCIESPLARVVDTKGRSKSKWRPQALDTVELEKLASRKLRINAKETMRIAEKLYTNGFISYPRTETNMFTKEIDLRALVEEQTRDENWGEFAQGVLERGPTPRNGNKTDNAHPPIHPTKYTHNLQGDEKRVYEFVVRHFLACCSQDAQGFETTVEIDVAEERFTAQGLMITARNYLEVYTYEKWNAKEIPVFDKGDEFEPTSIEMKDGETAPPPLLSEADLIALMDKHGIGTDATHADHIETIKSRNYVGVRPDGRFVPGQLGMGLVEGYDAMGFEMSKPHLRSELEADLKRICEGTKQQQAVLQEQVRKYKEVFIEACRQAEKIDESLSNFLGEEAQPAPADSELNRSSSSPVLKCPMCGSDMLLKAKKDGKGFYIGCMGFPDCKSAVWLPGGVLEADVSNDTCPKCGPDTHLVNFKFKRGSVPPTVPLEYTGCVGGCDETLVTDVGIRPPPRPGSGAQSQRTNSTPSQRGGGQAGPRSQRPNVQPAQGARGQTGAGRGQSRRDDSGIGSSFGSNGSSRQFSTQSSMQSTFPRNTPNQARNQSWGDQNMFDDSFDSNFSSQTQTGSSNFSQIPTGRNSVKKSKSNTQNSRTGSDRVPLATMTGNVMDSGNNDSANSVVCNCGNDAVLLTVRKEGPNTGRQFYKCGGSTCNFFLWSDEAGADPGGGGNDGGGGSASFSTNRVSSSSYSSNRGGTSNYGNNSFQGNQGGRGNSWSTDGGGAGGGDTVTCQCGQPAKSLTVQKEGPNKGRPFYGCPQPRGQGCTFFQWGDEDPGAGGVGGRGFSSGRGGGGASRGRGGSKKRPASSDGGGPAKKGKKCGLCGVEGHTKRTCPHK